MKPTQVTLTPVWRQVRDPLNTYWAKPRMSWDVLNTFNIWQRTHPDGTHRKEIQFGQSSKSIYQQRVIAIRFLKGYHAEVVRTKKFERWYLPNKLPAIHVEPPKNVDVTSFVEGRERAGGRTRDDKFALRKQEMAQVPIGSMLYGQVERRLDTVVFRACFAPSIYAARMAVTTGKVKLNGQTVRNPNVLLNPGDLFTVDPQAISFIQDPELQSKKAKGEEEDAKEVDSEESAVEAESSAEAATSEATESANATITTPPTPSTPTSPASKPTTFFRLPHYAQAHIFVPAYILPNYKTCSAVYVRHPTARANYSEVPSPFDAGGELTSLAWEWYTHKAPRMRSKVFRWENPQRSKMRWQIPRPEFMKGPETYAEKKTLRSKDAAEKKFRRSKMFPPGVRPA